MKFLVDVCVMIFVMLKLAEPQDRGCIYAYGECYKECPEGTHSYTPNYSTPWTWEPTCEEPNPKIHTTPIYDYSACYCNPLTVRDTASKQCVTLDKCPEKNQTCHEEAQDQ